MPKKGWPKLRSKGAVARHLSRYALHLMRTMGDGSTHDNLVWAICDLLCQFYDLMKDSEQSLTADAKEKLPVIGNRLARYYTQLADEYKVKGIKLFKVSPKLHLFVHLCETQAPLLGNPRFWWTYSDEDFVGLMVEVSQTCHPSTLSVNAIFKWLHLMFDTD